MNPPIAARRGAGAAPLARLSGRLAAWRYRGDRRDLRLDLLRGLAVVAMVADHIGGERSWLYHLTGGNRFWTSAAEGFVFISGLVMGIVYAGVLARQGLRAMLLKALRRARTLYALTVLLTLATAALADGLHLAWAPQVTAATLPDFVVGVLTAHRAFYLTDVLLLYVLLVLAGALALWCLAEGYTWQVLASSWVLWGLWQRWPQQAALPWEIADDNIFQLAAWQLLFMNGLVIGYHRRALARYFGWLTGRVALVVSGALFAGSIGLYRAQLAPLVGVTGLDATALAGALFAKSDERIGRVVVFAIFAVFMLALVTNLWQPLRRALGWLLLPLGQDALWAYGLHLFVIVATTRAGPQLFGPGPLTAGQNTGLQLGGIALIWALIILRPQLARLVPPPAARRQRPEGDHPAGHRRIGPRVLASLRAAALLALLLGGTLANGALALAGWTAPAGAASGLAVTPPSDPPPSAAPTMTPGAAPGAPVAFLQPAPAAAQATAGAGAGHRRHEELPPTPTPAPTPVAVAPHPAGATPARLVAGEFASTTLGRAMRYYVVVPQGYDDNPAVRYPVLYYLHGMSGDPAEWLRYGVQEAAADLIGDGTILPFIIVLPAGDQGYWVDQVNGGPQYATYVARDVVAEIDAHYRTLPLRQYRAIGGLSMGAHGALQIALNHADVFGIVGAHSPSFRTGADIPAYFGTGSDLAARDPLQLVAAHPDIARGLTIWLDFGPDDFFIQGQEQLEHELVAGRIPHTFHQYPGGHTTEYWTAHVGDYLRFYAAAFAGGR